MVLARLFGRRHADEQEQLFKAPGSSALTRWLRQGLEQGICPLCRVVHKADREYIWQFSEEGWANADTMGELVQARGFCQEHAQMLVRIDVQAKSMLGIAGVYADLFEALLERFDALDERDRTANALCPACANREQVLRQNVGYLLGLLEDDPTFTERFRTSTGLCFAHFGMIWTTGGSTGARALLLAVQRRAIAVTGDQLREFIRKEGVEARDEPKAGEQLAWKRAIERTAGWPAQPASAGVPETSDQR